MKSQLYDQHFAHCSDIVAVLSGRLPRTSFTAATISDAASVPSSAHAGSREKGRVEREAATSSDERAGASLSPEQEEVDEDQDSADEEGAVTTVQGRTNSQTNSRANSHTNSLKNSHTNFAPADESASVARFVRAMLQSVHDSFIQYQRQRKQLRNIQRSAERVEKIYLDGDEANPEDMNVLDFGKKKEEGEGKGLLGLLKGAVGLFDVDLDVGHGRARRPRAMPGLKELNGDLEQDARVEEAVGPPRGDGPARTKIQIPSSFGEKKDDRPLTEFSVPVLEEASRLASKAFFVFQGEVRAAGKMLEKVQL